MNIVTTIGIIAAGAAAFLTGASYIDPTVPGPMRLLAPIIISHDDLEKCAAWAEYDEAITRPGANVIDVIMDMGMEGHFDSILELAAAYDRRFHIPTVYSIWRDSVPYICLKFKLSGKEIIIPPYTLGLRLTP